MPIYGSLLCTIGGCINKRINQMPYCRKHQKSHDAALNAAMVKLAREDAIAKANDVLATISRNTRVRIFYGDAATGQAWAEENDVTGYVGRSTGTVKIPLLVHNQRSIGGGAILTDCIVAIVRTSDKTWLYKHPAFNPGRWFRRAEDNVVTLNGAVHASGFKTVKSAQNYIAFMTGERMAH